VGGPGQQSPVLERNGTRTVEVVNRGQPGRAIGDRSEFLNEMCEVEVVPGCDIEEFVERLILGATTGCHHDALCRLEPFAKTSTAQGTDGVARHRRHHVRVQDGRLSPPDLLRKTPVGRIAPIPKPAASTRTSSRTLIFTICLSVTLWGRQGRGSDGDLSISDRRGHHRPSRTDLCDVSHQTVLGQLYRSRDRSATWSIVRRGRTARPRRLYGDDRTASHGI
jgi:hypothetical protein